MQTRRLILFSTLAFLSLASGAQAANVIVGSPLTGAFSPTTFGSSITAFNSKLPSGSVTSPVDGIVVGWHLIDGSGGPYYLQVLKPVGGEYTSVGKSAPSVPLSTGIERFAAALPIEAGQTVAIEGTHTSDGLGGQLGLGGEFSFFLPELGEGATAAPNPTVLPAELGFNAEVQPAPTIGSLGATSGPSAGGTFVTITGTDFTGVKDVGFGTSKAPYTVDSETQITAAAPAGPAGSVPVTVTTIAGSATASQQFSYTAPTTAATPAAPITTATPTCKVPKIAGRKLKGAKVTLRKADCKIGTVTKKKGVTAKSGKVVGQSPKPGKVLAAGTKIKLVLGG